MTSVLINGSTKDPVMLVLAHGAGAPMDHPFMSTLATGLAERGIQVVRFEFPYMARRRETGKRSPPDRSERLEACFREVITRYRDSRPMLLGGKSMGGRVASRLADEQQADGLIVFGYPFHPPGKPEALRLEPLQKLSAPALILQGERDPFGTRAEVTDYALPSSLTFAWLTDGDHSFQPRKASGLTLEDQMAVAVQYAAEWIQSRILKK